MSGLSLGSDDGSVPGWRRPLTDDARGRPSREFNDGKRQAVVAYDLTFTAPKSLSVLGALADDARRAALASSLELVQPSVIRTRISDARRHQVRARGMLAAGLDHIERLGRWPDTDRPTPLPQRNPSAAPRTAPRWVL